MSGIRPPGCSKLAKKSEKWQWRQDFPTWHQRHSFFDVVLFLLSSLVIGRSFMSISSLVLELWQFSFIRDWPEIRKSEIPTSEFFPVSGDWGELWIPNLTQLSLIECYWMLQNSRVTGFTVFELLRENQLGSKITPSPLPPTLGLNPENPAKLGSLIFSYVGLSWVLKNYELGLAGLAGFWKVMSWV